MTRTFVGLVAGLGFCLVALSLVWAGFTTRATVRHLERFETAEAITTSKSALPVARFLNQVTFQQLSDARLWVQLLELPPLIHQLRLQALSASTALSSADTTQPLIESSTLEQLSFMLQRLTADVEQSWLLSSTHQSQATTHLTQASDLVQLLQHITQTKQRYLIFFQNSDELRATGGFIGSYALLELDHGKIRQLSFQDIYEPDGQFTGYYPAPPGVEEYLSGGNGLRLPDANWSPDFPTSAQQVLQFMALGGVTDIDGVVAINSQVLVALLEVVGELYLPDYGITVTPSNILTQARADRDEFFAGSKQKVHFLESVFTQLKLQAAQLDADQTMRLADVIKTGLEHKDIQLYSHDPIAQTIWDQYNVAGRALPPSDGYYLYWIESNVGINKANSAISRQLEITLGDTTSTIEAEFINHHSTETELGYTNYQRLLIPTTYQVANVMHGDQDITWRSNLVTTDAGEELQQIGFLMQVPAANTSNVTIELTTPSSQAPHLTLQKQSGLSPTPIIINYAGEQYHHLLEQDVVLELKTSATR